VPDADVVIVNPTHYAVALSWDRSPGSIPRVVAKGVDEVAAKIREIAINSAVPLHSDPPTARAIYATIPIGETIDEGKQNARFKSYRGSNSLEGGGGFGDAHNPRAKHPEENFRPATTQKGNNS